MSVLPSVKSLITSSLLFPPEARPRLVFDEVGILPWSIATLRSGKTVFASFSYSSLTDLFPVVPSRNPGGTYGISLAWFT